MMQMSVCSGKGGGGRERRREREEKGERWEEGDGEVGGGREWEEKGRGGEDGGEGGEREAGVDGNRIRLRRRGAARLPSCGASSRPVFVD
jgi:hypothetical protein